MMKRLLDLPDDNVIFLRDVQGVRWIGAVDGLGRYTLIALAVVLGLALLSGVLLWWGYGTAGVSGVFLLPFNLFGNIRGIVELAAVFYGVGLISNERTAGRLDLIRLAIGERAFVEAKHALTVVRTWRIAAFYVVGQVAGTLSLVTLGALSLFDASVEESLSVTVADLAWVLLPVVLGAALVAALVAALLTIWQMRALAALSVNISARTTNRGGAVALGIVGWIVIRVLMGALYAVLYLPWLVGSFGILVAEPDLSGQVILWAAGALCLVVPLYAAFVIYLVYVIYRWIRRRLLQNTAHLLMTTA